MATKTSEISDWMNQIDIDDKTQNVIPKSANLHQLIALQSETHKDTINELVSCVTKALGDDTEEQLKTSLGNIVKKNSAISRMIQSRNDEANTKAKGSLFDPLRTPICMPPEAIKKGTKEEVSDSALKLLHSFKGDTEEESDNLRMFLRNVYDISVTNKLNEEATKAILLRKLTGTARKLMDSFIDEFPDETKTPSLNDIVIKLEDRFAATLSPELANARLNVLKKTPTMTYSQLEGTISELTTLAARAEVGDKKVYVSQRRIDVLKQAISEEDRLLVTRENQTRILNGIGEMNLSQCIDCLIKYHSEKKTFSQVNTVMSTPLGGEGDSVCAAKEKKSPKKNKAKKAQEDNDHLYQLCQDLNRRFGLNNNSRGRGRGNYNRGRGQYKNKGNRPATNGQSQGGPPKKFVTFQMVNVNPHCCLKCNSPDHRFSETDKCVYGKYALMTKPCTNCKEGGHDPSVCMKDKNSNNGQQNDDNKKPLDPRYSNWPEINKAAPEVGGEYQLFPPKNDYLPSLFPK